MNRMWHKSVEGTVLVFLRQENIGLWTTDLLDEFYVGVALWGEIVSFCQQGDDVRAGEAILSQIA